MHKLPNRSALLFALLSTAAVACLARDPGPARELWPAQGCTVGDVRHTARGGANVWFEHSLAGSPKVIKAVRLGFVPGPMPMATGRVGLLRAR
jgi:hypothetical protein